MTGVNKSNNLELEVIPSYNVQQIPQEMRSLIQKNETLPPESSATVSGRDVNKRVTLNIGGVKHEVLWKTLEWLPHTRLGRLRTCNTHEAIFEICDDYSLECNEYYFDRNPRSFAAILNLYRTGKLHLIEEMCVKAFRDELHYWGIDELYLDSCCQYKYNKRKEIISDVIIKEQADLSHRDQEAIGPGKLVHYQEILWNLLEKPYSSWLAQILSVISIIVIILLAVTVNLNTIESFQEYDPRTGQYEENHKLATIEDLCIGWVTVEFVLRLISSVRCSSPRKWQFLKGILITIDFIAILSYFKSCYFTNTQKSSDLYLEVSRIFQILRLMRIPTNLNFTRHSMGLKSLGLSLTNNLKELGFIGLYFAIGVMIFSSLTYFSEKDELDTPFRSIPDTFWWTIIKITTVGYGDIVPKTFFGKIIGCACCFSGALGIILLIPIFLNNFTGIYKKQMRGRMSLNHRETLEQAKREGHIISFQNANLNDPLPNSSNILVDK